MLAKLLSLVTLIWFYKTAKDSNENAIQWAVIGFIGFWLSAIIAHYAITSQLTPGSTTDAPKIYLLRQLHLESKGDEYLCQTH